MTGDLKFDVVIITAMEDELQELRRISAGSPDSEWVEEKDGSGYPYFRRSFDHENGWKIRIAAASAAGKGETAATAAASRLITELRPHCLAMCGICAGRRKKAFLGDVIVAAQVFKYDGGKLKAHIDGSRERIEEIFQEISSYKLDSRWQKYVELCAKGKEWLSEIADSRPPSFDYQTRWLLYCLAEGGEPREQSDFKKCFSDVEQWSKVLDCARDRGFLYKRGLTITRKGKEHVEELKVSNLDEFKTLKPDPKFRVHLGDLGTGSRVVVDENIFQALARQNRMTLGLEMEAHAIGFVAEIERLPNMIVVKGVQDYADEEKSDYFRAFASRASADFLIRFLRRHLSPPRLLSSSERIEDSPGPYEAFTVHHPTGKYSIPHEISLSAEQGLRAENDPRVWKSVHSIAENLLKVFITIESLLYKAEMDKGNRDTHKRYASEYLSDRKREFERAHLFSDSEIEASPINLLRTIPYCFLALSGSIAVPFEDRQFRMGVLLVKHMARLLWDTLHVADQILELYFQRERKV